MNKLAERNYSDDAETNDGRVIVWAIQDLTEQVRRIADAGFRRVSPVTREALSDDQLIDLWWKTCDDEWAVPDDVMVKFGRAVLSASPPSPATREALSIDTVNNLLYAYDHDPNFGVREFHAKLLDLLSVSPPAETTKPEPSIKERIERLAVLEGLRSEVAEVRTEIAQLVSPPAEVEKIEWAWRNNHGGLLTAPDEETARVLAEADEGVVGFIRGGEFFPSPLPSGAEQSRSPRYAYGAEWEYGEFGKDDIQEDGSIHPWAEPLDTWETPPTGDDLTDLADVGSVCARRVKAGPWVPVKGTEK